MGADLGGWNGDQVWDTPMNQIMPLMCDDFLFDLHEEEYRIKNCKKMDFGLDWNAS